MDLSMGERLGSEEAAAWAALAANLLVLPGLGSLMASRKAGWLQAALALAGAALSLVWLIAFARVWIRLGAFPLGEELDMATGLLGIALFAAAWLWSLATSLDLLRQSRRR
jgi:hypothetical protein